MNDFLLVTITQPNGESRTFKWTVPRARVYFGKHYDAALAGDMPGVAITAQPKENT